MSLQIKSTNIAELSELVFNEIKAVLEAKPNGAIIALSGGSTPKVVYEKLGRYLKNFQGDVDIIQVDERYVNIDSERRNHKMIASTLDLKGNPKVHFLVIPSLEEGVKVSEAATNYSKMLQKRFPSLQLDLIILGMGKDGHTASLFPFNQEYEKSMKSKSITLGTFVESQNEDRISLGPNIIFKAGKRILMISGSEKGKVLASALEAKNQMKFPISNFLDSKTIVIMDESSHESFRKWKS